MPPRSRGCALKNSRSGQRPLHGCVASARKHTGKTARSGTDTQFEVVEQNKGLLPGLVTIRTLGGTIGGLHSRVEGVPEFRAGEEAYVFLWGREGEPHRILGWSQGTFRIARDARTGVETVTQDSAAAPLFDPRTREFVRSGIRNLPVASFQMKLRKALEEKVP